MSYLEIIIGIVVLFAINFFASRKNKNNKQDDTNTQMEDISEFEINTSANRNINTGRELTKRIIKEPVLNLSSSKTIIIFIIILIIVGALYTFYTGEIPIDILRYLF